MHVTVEAWATITSTSAATSSDRTAPRSQVAIARAPAGHAAPNAVSTCVLVRATRLEGRQTTALPATSADMLTTVGTQIGEFAECRPRTTP